MIANLSPESAARALGLSAARLKAFVRAGLVGSRGDAPIPRLSFQDLVLLRAADRLVGTTSIAKLRAAIDGLRAQMPAGTPITAVAMSAEGGEIHADDGSIRWIPASGQTLLDLDAGGEGAAGPEGTEDGPAEGAPVVCAPRSAAGPDRSGADPEEDRARPRDDDVDAGLDADDWHRFACSLEAEVPAQAREAYRRALEIDPDHAPAHINLGRLLHEEGNLLAAERHYRAALRIGHDATAAFNLGVCLQDQGRAEEAVGLYRTAASFDPDCPDVHYNLAQVYDQLGRTALALRHLQIYRSLL